MLIDRYGLLWNGNNFFDPNRTLFDFHEIISPKSGQAMKVAGVLEIDDSTLLVSTFEGHFWYDLRNRTYQAVNFDRETTIKETPLSDDNANWIVFLLEGNILICDATSKWFYKFSLEKNGQAFSFNSMGFVFDEWDNLWFGSWGEGVIRIKSAVWKNADGPIRDFDQWLPDDPVRSLPTANVLGEIVDSQNNLWVASSPGGLTRIDGQHETVRTIDFTPDEGGPSSTRIAGLVEGVQGNIWMVGGELYKYDPIKDQLTTYNHKDGLKNEDLFNIHVDREGDLWLNGRLGITRFNPREKKFTLYNQYDGLVSWEYNGRVSKRTNRMYWGGTRGFHAADIDQIKNKPKQASQLVITDIKTYDPKREEVVPLQPLDWSDQQLEFSYRQNVLNIRFAVLDFRNNNRHQYQYAFSHDAQLNWVDLGNENQLTLNQLAPGKYFLHLKGRNSDEIWTELATPLKIVIHPPLWQTTWAYALYLLLLGIGVYWLYRNTLTRQLAKNEARQLKALERLRARFYTNITHEFRTPLTVILGLTETEQDYPKSMQLIRRNGQKLLQLINQLLNLSKLDNNALPPDYQQIEIVSFTRYLGESFHSLAEKKQIQLNIVTEIEQLHLDMDEEMYRQIVFNLLSNAIKFTPQKGRVRLS